MPTKYPLHLFKALGVLSLDDESKLSQLGEKPVAVSSGEVIYSEGEEVDGIYLLMDGWVSSSVLLRNGLRLIQKLHLPGDMMGVPSLVLPRSADTLTALTEATVAYVPRATISALFESRPRITAMLFMSAQLERLALMDTLASTGHSTAMKSMAHLFLSLHLRLTTLGMVQNDSFRLPVTQEMLGDLLGITTVHTNRTLREMARQGLIAFEGRTLQLLDLPALEALSLLPLRKPEFNPEWMPKG